LPTAASGLPENDRPMRLLALILLFAVYFGTRSIEAETLNKEMQINLDPVGDGTLVIKERYGAAAWIDWKEREGDHLDRVVRDTKRDFAAWEFYDFSFSKDEVSRTAESRMRVRALAQISNDGSYTLDKLLNGLHLVTNKGNEWIWGGRSSGDTPQSDDTELTVHVNLPAAAYNAHIINPESSQTEFVYSVAAPASGSQPLLFLAGGFGIFGVILLGISWPSQETLRLPLPFFLKTHPTLPALPAPTKWQLVGRTTGGRTLRLEITDAMFASNGNRLVLGRTAELCHVVIDDGSVSKQHAQIRKEGGSFVVADRNSANGTAVNGQLSMQPFSEVPLKDGDTLTLGEVRLDFSKG
jgi:hypothetical protein